MNPGELEPQTAEAVSAFTVRALPSGRMFTVGAGETILAAGIRQGVAMPYGCKDGACGSCKCKKLEGQVLHGPHQSKALSAEEEAQGFVLTCCAVAHSDVTLESRQITDQRAHPVRKMPARVIKLEKRSRDVMVVHLQLPANGELRFHAGQYVEFVLRDGARRSYSIANAPHNGSGVELHIRHLPGGKFTDHVFGAMKEKEILRVEGPFGTFYLREDSDKPIVLLASGTGFAPIKAVIEHMRFIGTPRSATLYWGGRRPEDLYLDSWVRAQMELMPNLRYVPVISNAWPEDGWTGRAGFVHEAVLQDVADLSGHQVYACGAPIVVNSARAAYTTRGKLPSDEFYADAFISEYDKSRGS